MWLYASALLTVAALYIIKKVVTFRRFVLGVGYVSSICSLFIHSEAQTIRRSNIPGYRVIINTNSEIGFFLPRIPGVTQGRNYALDDKHSGGDNPPNLLMVLAHGLLLSV